MRHAISDRVAVTGRARLEHGTRHVPLEQMHAPAVGRGEVCDLVDDQALARAGNAGQEHHAPRGEAAELGLEDGIGVDDQRRREGHRSTAGPPRLDETGGRNEVQGYRPRTR